MKRMFISMPMKDKSYGKIVEERDKIARNFQSEYKIIDSIASMLDMSVDIVNTSVRYLAESIKHLSTADVVLFAKGWEEARGCRIEHEIAKQYGIEIMYEE